MKYRFSDIVDIPTVQRLMDNLWQASGIPTGIIDIDGTVLVATGWQKICTDFHRAHPQAATRCRESDAYLSSHLRSGKALPECGYIEYRCKNGMIDIGMPIIVEGHHLANLFLGQFFYEPPDEEYFRKQAREFGVDQEAYLEALRTVPIFSHKKVRDILAFNTGLVDMLTRMGVDKLRQLEAQKELRTSEEKFRTFFLNSTAGMTIIDPDGTMLEVNTALCQLLGFTEKEMVGKTVEEITHPDDRRRTRQIYRQGKEGTLNRFDYEKRYMRKDGSTVWGHASGVPLYYENGRVRGFIALVQDISDRKQAEEILRESERRHATLMANLPGMVYRCRNDRNWTMEFVSEGARALTGYAPEDLIENKKLTFNEIIHPDDREFIWKHIQSSVLDERPFQLEYRLRTAEGEERWVWERGRGVFGEGGDLLALEGFITDITERKQAKEALQKSEERLSMALHVSNEGVWDWNLKTDEVFFSPRYFNMLGYEPEEFPSCFENKTCFLFPSIIQIFDRLLHPEDREKTVARSRELVQTGEYFEMEFRMVAKDGTPVHILSRGEAVEFDSDGKPTRMVGTHMDITERKKAEETARAALAEAEQAREKIDAILKSVADGLVVTDLSGRVVLMNRTAEKLSGVTLGEAFSRPVDTLFAAKDFNREISSVLTGTQKEAQSEWELLPPDSRTPTMIQARTSLVLSRDGHTTGTITLLRDVTRERELDRMKNEFISTAAHELRTPLTVVMGFSEVLLAGEKYGRFDPEKQKEILSSINEKAHRLEQIVSDLLDLSRIQSGQMVSLDRAPCDICKLLRRILDDYQKKPGRHLFSLSLPKGPLELSIDRGKVEQVLENLISNAVKFSPEASQIDVVGKIAGDSFQVSVTDKGSGMTPEQVERVFDKFYRVDASDTAAEGLGLGMSITKSIIEAHGGTIRVESKPGEGTTVTFSIPIEIT